MDHPPRGRRARCSPPTPADSSLARAAAALAEREFEVAAHTAGPLDRRRRSPTPPCSSSPTPPTRSGRRPSTAARRCSTRPRSTRSSAFVARRRRPDRPRRDRAGQVRQQPQRAARPLRHRRSRTPPSRTTSTTTATRPPGSSPRSATPPASLPAGADPLAGVAAACFYRAGTLARRQRRPRDRPRAPDRLDPERAARRRSPPTAPAASSSLADSDLFGDDCIADLDHEHALAQPRLLGRPARASPPPRAGADSPVTADPAWTRLKAAVEELRLTQAPDGSVDTADHDADKLRNLAAAIAESAQALKPRFPHQHDYIDALAADLLAWADAGFAQARLRPLARGLPPRARPPRRDRAPRASSRCTSRTPRATPASRRSSSASPGREWIAELERDPLRQRQVPPGHPRRLHRRLRLRVRRPLPGDLLDRRAARRLPLRRDLLRPRGRALPPRLRRRRRDPAPQPAARRRLPALARRELSESRLHALGPRSTTAPTCAATCPSTRS